MIVEDCREKIDDKQKAQYHTRKTPFPRAASVGAFSSLMIANMRDLARSDHSDR
jgi:hypothetical protein